MKLLTLDTSSVLCSAALTVDGTVFHASEKAPRRHAELILPMIDDLLQQADIQLQHCDAIAYGRGPGSFTGIRLAASITQGLAFGAKLPVIAISSLQIIAQTAYKQHQQQHLLACIDARMHEFYWAEFKLADNGLMHGLGQERLSAWSVLQSENKAGLSLAGYAEDETLSHFCLPDAVAMLPIAEAMFNAGQLLTPEQCLPVYIRDQVV